MRYALNLPIGGPAADPRHLGELAAVAEAAGWDAVFVEDYVVYHRRRPSGGPGSSQVSGRRWRGRQ